MRAHGRDFVPCGGSFEAHAADGDDVAGDIDAELDQQGFGDRAEGHARGGFAGAGALQDVAGIGEIVLDGAGQIGVSGAGAGDGLALVFGTIHIFDRAGLRSSFASRGCG